MNSFGRPANFKYPRAAIFITVITLYFLFTELMIPAYSIIPRFSILYKSFFDLYNYYPLKSGFLDTFISVTVSGFLIYFVFKIIGIFICYLYITLPAIRHLNVFYKYTPQVFFMIFFIMLFDYSYIAEIVFLSLMLMMKYSGQIFNSLSYIPYDLMMSYRSMNNSLFVILRKILWRHALVDIKKKLPEYFILSWGYAIIYEIIGNSVGLGKVINYLLDFQDYYGLITLAVAVSLFILVCDKLIKVAVYYSTFWES